eukprot:scaffold36169_cov107-Isochrysis_galbana.AAC.2
MSLSTVTPRASIMRQTAVSSDRSETRTARTPPAGCRSRASSSQTDSCRGSPGVVDGVGVGRGGGEVDLPCAGSTACAFTGSLAAATAAARYVAASLATALSGIGVICAPGTRVAAPLHQPAVEDVECEEAEAQCLGVALPSGLCDRFAGAGGRVGGGVDVGCWGGRWGASAHLGVRIDQLNRAPSLQPARGQVAAGGE